MPSNTLNSQESKNWIQRGREHPVIAVIGLLLSGFTAGFAVRDIILPDTCILFCRDFRATIEHPEAQTLVDQDIKVSGKAYNKSPANTQIWLVVRTYSDKGVAGFYPQGDGAISLQPANNKNTEYTWSHQAKIGQNNQDKKKRFDLIVYSVPTQHSQSWGKYIRNCRGDKKDCFSPQKLPLEYQELDKVQVVRK